MSLCLFISYSKSLPPSKAMDWNISQLVSSITFSPRSMLSKYLSCSHVWSFTPFDGTSSCHFIKRSIEQNQLPALIYFHSVSHGLYRACVASLGGKKAFSTEPKNSVSGNLAKNSLNGAIKRISHVSV